MPPSSGRLELIWTNTDAILIAHGEGTYGWVGPSDHRVAGAPLLPDVATVGLTNSDRQRAADHLLIRGGAHS